MKAILIISFQIPLILLGQPKKVFVPDETISNIRLVDSTSALKKYPKLNQLAYTQTDETNPFANFKFYNKDSSEILALIIYPGAYKNCFYVFNVTKTSNVQVKFKVYSLPDNFFITESGIKIGLTKSELLAIKGTPFQIKTEQGNEILCYKINSFDSDTKILSKYNMPEYYADYTFKQSRLIKFEFGFTYP